MSREDVEIVRDHFAATNEGDFARALGCYADDVELLVPADAFLESGTFKGRDAVGDGSETGSVPSSGAITSIWRKHATWATSCSS
jgi:ketosteroid isomerase-like protein